MLIQIPGTGVIKKQKLDIGEDVSIIYGYNNCGKTTLLKVLNDFFSNRLMEQFILGKAGETAIYIPTNRIVISEHNTDMRQLNDYEEFVNYQKDSYKDYSLHLKRLRDNLLANEVIHNFICKAIYKIFEIDVKKISDRYSDGIENIINIYLNVIWAMIWDIDIADLTEELFYKLLFQKRIYVMIDEIEMFLHVNIQSKLIGSMKEDFANCSFILTTHSPLLLTRYKQCVIYSIRKGRLDRIDDDVYYEDLDIIYEELFGVEELPMQIREDINYLGNVILKKKDIDTKKINDILNKLINEYPNLYRRYNAIITKVKDLGEQNDKNQKRKCAKRTVEDQ